MSIPRDQRVSKNRPCAACLRVKPFCFYMKSGDLWCGFASTMNDSAGRSVPGKRWKGGWIHRVVGAVAAPTDNRELISQKRSVNWPKFANRWSRAALPETVESLAKQLGVSAESLHRLQIGFASRDALKMQKTKCSDGGAFTFPMVDGRCNVVGIRLRTPSGFKFAVDSSNGSGLFVPSGIPAGCDLVAGEGPTTTAALLTANLAGVGRPNCRAGVEYLREFCRRLQPRALVILGDNDKPDKQGRLAGKESIEEVRRQMQGAAPVVRTALPPSRFKDFREWLKHGARPREMAGWLGVRIVDELMTGRVSA